MRAISEIEARVWGIVVSCLFGAGLPAFLPGPWLFDGVGLGDLPRASVYGALAHGLFGLWLLAVSILARAGEIARVLEPFRSGNEVALVFLPFMLYVGTRAIWRHLAGRAVPIAPYPGPIAPYPGPIAPYPGPIAPRTGPIAPRTGKR